MAFSSSLVVSLCCSIVCLSFTIAQAKEFIVGGNTDAWAVPASTSYTLNKWAEANRFQVGDTLVWNYDPEKDSVLRVTRDAYLTCNTTNPIESYKNRSTIVTLNHSGAHYFISGNSDNCLKGEKVIVVVMSEHHKLRKHLAPAPAPESIIDLRAPALAPMAGAQDRIVVARGMIGLLLVVGFLALGFWASSVLALITYQYFEDLLQIGFINGDTSRLQPIYHHTMPNKILQKRRKGDYSL